MFSFFPMVAGSASNQFYLPEVFPQFLHWGSSHEAGNGSQKLSSVKLSQNPWRVSTWMKYRKIVHPIIINHQYHYRHHHRFLELLCIARCSIQEVLAWASVNFALNDGFKHNDQHEAWTCLSFYFLSSIPQCTAYLRTIFKQIIFQTLGGPLRSDFGLATMARPGQRQRPTWSGRWRCTFATSGKGAENTGPPG